MWCDVMWCDAMRCDAICDVISVMCYLFRYFSTISVWLCGKYFNVGASSWINEFIHSLLSQSAIWYDMIWYMIWYDSEDIIPKIHYTTRIKSCMGTYLYLFWCLSTNSVWLCEKYLNMGASPWINKLIEIIHSFTVFTKCAPQQWYDIVRMNCVW